MVVIKGRLKNEYIELMKPSELRGLKSHITSLFSYKKPYYIMDNIVYTVYIGGHEE